MQAAVTANQIGGGILLFIMWVVLVGINVVGGVYLYRFATRVLPDSSHALLAVLSFFPVVNLYGLFPWCCGADVGWTTGKRVMMILFVTYTWIGWLVVISSWRRGLKIKAHPAPEPMRGINKGAVK
jgi:hypothetical protein